MSRARVHPLALLALLAGEGLLLGIRYDSASLEHLPGGWWDVLREAVPRAMPLTLAVATAGLLIVGPRISRQLANRPPIDTRPRAEHPPRARRRRWGLLAAHLLAFAALFALSELIFTGSRTVLLAPGPWVAAWLLAAALSVGLWVAAVLPPGRARALVAEFGGVVLLSVACGAIAWAAGRYTQSWWDPLRGYTFATVATLLRWADPSAWTDPARYLVGSRDFVVEITAPCSGYEGVGLTWVCLGVWFWFARDQLRFPRVLWLLAVATVAVWLANALRIAALVLIGSHVSADVAAGAFHSYAGALLFSAIILSTAWVAHRSPAFSRVAGVAAAAPAIDPEPSRGVNPAAPYLLPLMALAFVDLTLGLLSTAAVGALAPLRVAVPLAVLWCCRARYPSASWAISPGAIWIGAGVFVAWVAIGELFPWHEPARGDTPPPHPGPEGTASPPAGTGPTGSAGALWIISRAVGMIAVAPVVEELAFRGFLARRLMAADFDTVPYSQLSWTAIAISSLLFAVLHVHVIAAAIAAAAYAWAVRRHGRLTDAVAAHAVTNLLLTAYALAFGRWHVWN